MLVAVELIWLRACLPSLALPQWPRRAAAAAKLFEVLRGNGNGAEHRGRYLSEGGRWGNWSRCLRRLPGRRVARRHVYSDMPA